MRRRIYTVEETSRWVAEADRICSEAEQLVIVEGGSRGSRAALGTAMVLRQSAIAKLEEARRTS